MCARADAEVGWQRVKCSLSAIKIRQTSEVLKTVDSCVHECQMISQRRLAFSFILKAPAEKLRSDFMNEVSRHRLALSSIIVLFVRFGRSEAEDLL